ncbi:MAG TPA: NAD-dependent epimerase/dehydratase family protein, partial [Polyangiaceae bacterium]|nr:NAD-dependent epimerase/dehydratase family protein [Polyangiaceae bacterium]
MTIAFVAGASGYTGREVVKTLRERGIRTIAHVRPDSPSRAEHRAYFAELGAESDETPWEEEAIAATIARLRPTHVFALLGITKKRAAAEARETGREVSYDSVDYGLTVMLLRAAKAVKA